MKNFLFSTLFLLLLWGAFFLYEGTFQPIHILICALIITLYFFVSVSKNPVYIYTIIQNILLVLYGIISENHNPYAFLLIIFFGYLAIHSLSQQSYKIYGIITLAFYLVLQLMELHQWAPFFFLLLFFMVAILANNQVVEKNEKAELYEELLGEYRKLKRLVHLAEEEARNEERTKIARDIHDSVGHKLTALLMQLEILSMQNGEENYQELKALAKDSLEETRFAVRTLKTSEHEGISTILQLIKRLESESHIQVHFTTKQGILSVKLTNAQSVVLYRVIQEGLTNAMRHAHSKEVYVVLGRNAIGDIEFSIKNRIYSLSQYREGFGLQNMRKRVEEVGGNLSIFQTESEFVVQGTIPVEVRELENGEVEGF